MANQEGSGAGKMGDRYSCNMKQAVGLLITGAAEPRPLAWAGMSQTFGLRRRAEILQTI